MLIKENCDGTIKAHGCTDGRKQCKKNNNSDTISPKVSKKAVLISTVIDAYEHRDMEVVDIPGAYLSADMDDGGTDGSSRPYTLP